jgi:hypothetical protein
VPYGILDMQAAYLCALAATPSPPPVASPPPSPPPPRPPPVVPVPSPPPPPGKTGSVCPPLGGWARGPCRLAGELFLLLAPAGLPPFLLAFPPSCWPSPLPAGLPPFLLAPSSCLLLPSLLPLPPTATLACPPPCPQIG